MLFASVGAGGGWSESNATTLPVTGKAIMTGAQGGQSCGRDDEFYSHGTGGFGGGGGGCTTGGGGGGFAGKNHSKSSEKMRSVF